MKLQQLLESHFDTTVTISKKTPVSGGSINKTYIVETSKGNFFVKENDALTYPNMFEAEAKGIELIYSTNTILTPKIIATGNIGSSSFLILDVVHQGRKTEKSWTSLGNGLANLHRNSNSKFGLIHNNYIGSLTQVNTLTNNWKDFYANYRIKPMVKMAFENNLFNTKFQTNFNNLYNELDSIFPEEPAALLHGDLWNGNFMINNKEQAVLIDPATYYGHREMDLGMTLLFGGFQPTFYNSYNDIFPLEKGWKTRVSITQLYPLLVHANLFGGGYINSVLDIIRKF